MIVSKFPSGGGGVKITYYNYANCSGTGSLSKVSTSLEALSVARSGLASVTVGGYGLFGGGNNGSSTVDAYNSSLVRSTPTALSVGRNSPAGVTAGNYGLFGGGSYASVDAYNSSLTRSTPSELTARRSMLAAVAVGSYGLFGGGNYGSPRSTVDAYNSSLVRSTPEELSVARYAFAAVTAGNYGLFGGGTTLSGGAGTAIDAYVLQHAEIPIGAGWKYKFEEHITEQTATANLTYITENTATGYIKVTNDATF